MSGDDRRDRQSFRYNADSELCQLHKFSVVSVNDAGEGLPATITETVPISESLVCGQIYTADLTCTLL